MKARQLLLFSLAVFGLFIINVLIPITAEAAVKDWQKGASIYTYDKEGFTSPEFKQSLKAWKATGATYVSFVMPYSQKDIYASEIIAKNYMPSDVVLTDAINYAHSIGLKVMLKVHITSDDGQWQAYINPTNRAQWFASYTTLLNQLGTLAESTKVEQICIGTEVITMTTNPENTQSWIAMINEVRSRYKGKLTYSANWGGTSFMEEVSNITFWDKLDYIGISAYYILASETLNPQVKDFVESWKYWDAEKIKPLHKKFNKPIIFTEVGYRSVQAANTDPYDGGRNGAIDLALQANLYQALLQYWNTKPYFAGIHIWDWKLDPLEGGPGNNQYTPRYKPAEQIIKNWFTNKTVVKAAAQNNYMVIGGPTVLNLTSGMTLTRGMQTFRANLLDRPNYTYVTSWQVDGGDYHWMNDNTNGHTLEEDTVDVSGWMWHGMGPYRLTFISREFSGKILAQKSVDVYLK
jgi:hypothetical protein